MINEFDKYKPKHTAIKFEEIEIAKMYAFTLNPKDSGNTQSKLTFRQSANTLMYIKRDLSAISQCLKSAEITIATEASQTCKVHYHGTVVINSFTDWLTELPLLMQLGTVCVKEIDDEKVWFEYCHKQSHIWKPFFQKTNLSYPYKVPIPVRLVDESNDGEE